MWKRIMNYKNINIYFIFVSYALSIIITILVYFTGGTSKVYANLMYIPIATVSSTNGKRVGLLHAVLSAFMVGPFMQLNTTLNINQQPINWITRLIIYAIIAFIIGFFSDFNKQNNEYITNLLTHDNITGFKNIEGLKKEASFSSDYKTIIALSVNQYDEILSLFGYNFTNEVILKISRLLKEILNEYYNILLYRYRGMEFVLIIPHTNEDINIEEVVDKIGELNKSIIKIDDIPIYIEIFMGMTRINGGDSTLEGLRQAMSSLRYAILNEKKLRKFDSSLDNHYKNIVNIASNFKSALDNDNIKVAYQNIYNLNTGEVYGMELLARWVTDTGLQIFPSDFIPVIEKTELINELTKHMINVAIEQLLIDKDIVISINFSPRDFKDEVVAYLIKEVKDKGINPRCLQIEITEDVLVHKEEAICYLELISNAGITIAIDDFGSGYSSLSYLSELPFNVIKIDKSIIQRMNTDILTRDLVNSIVRLCKNNNLLILAEGVETKEILDICIELDIELVQGFYYHKPTILNNVV